MPANKIDFVLIATNDGRSFMCLFNYGTSGTDLIYSENCHPRLAQDLKNTGIRILRLIWVLHYMRIAHIFNFKS